MTTAERYLSGSKSQRGSRVAGALRVLDVFGDLLGPVVRRGQIIKWTAGGAWREREAMILTHRGVHVDASV